MEPQRPNSSDESHSHKARPPRIGLLLFVAVLILAGGFIYGLLPRLREQRTVAADTRELAQLSVAVVAPAPSKAAAPLVLSGELKPEAETAIFARVNGYVRRWTTDLGAKVEAGQVLAELDTPDTDRELTQTRAQLAQAEAARDFAVLSAKRWKEMLAAKTVSPQEADEKASEVQLKDANVASAKARVQQLEEVAGFAKVTAPFTGTITARAVEVGQLVSPTDTRELFHIARTAKLRAFVHVPQAYARGTTVGQTAELTLPERPGQKFTAKIVRTAGALDASSRTLLAELEIDNSKDEIFAGSYAQIRLTEAQREAALTIPANAILFRAEGPQAAVVVDGRIALRHIVLGRDSGTSVEIQSGITASDRVVVNPADALKEGSAVTVVELGQK